jgi:cyclin-dependent kinase
MSEMATLRALFNGDSEIDQIYRIFRILGTPSNSIWPGVEGYRDYKAGFPKWHGSGICHDEGSDSPLGTGEGINLLKSFLIYDPVKRISAKRALQHPYFTETNTGMTHNGMNR